MIFMVLCQPRKRKVILEKRNTAWELSFLDYQGEEMRSRLVELSSARWTSNKVSATPADTLLHYKAYSEGMRGGSASCKLSHLTGSKDGLLNPVSTESRNTLSAQSQIRRTHKETIKDKHSINWKQTYEIKSERK